jgi:sulfur carrier protein
MNTMTLDSATATAADGDAVELRLDDRPHRVPAGTTLAGLVERLGHRPADVASAVNGAFVPRSGRDGCVLAAGDAVLLFKPIVGG